MQPLLRLLLICTIVGASGQAYACDWPNPSPRLKYSEHRIVALAYPLTISVKPAGAMARGFHGRFEQTIQWQVLVSWKGNSKPGDMLLTQRSYETGPCGTGALYEKAVQLLYVEDGSEPFRGFLFFRPDESLDDMKFLDGKRRGA